MLEKWRLQEQDLVSQLEQCRQELLPLITKYQSLDAKRENFEERIRLDHALTEIRQELQMIRYDPFETRVKYEITGISTSNRERISLLQREAVIQDQLREHEVHWCKYRQCELDRQRIPLLIRERDLLHDLEKIQAKIAIALRLS